MLDLEKHNSSRVNSYTSKGNLPKWLIGDNWYKLDFFGYESLAEYLVSHLLIDSNISNCILYDIKKVFYKNERNACISNNFLNKTDEIVTVERLHLAEKGIGLSKKLSAIKSVEEKIVYTIEFVNEYTKINDFQIYLTKMLELDMFFLNEDRHTNNIAFIRNTNSKKYKVAPIFDNGLSLLSDLLDFPISVDVYKNISKVKSKPFCSDFVEQVECAEKLYGTQLKFSFDKNDIEKYLNEITSYFQNEVIERVRAILYEQMRKYNYLFKE